MLKSSTHFDAGFFVPLHQTLLEIDDLHHFSNDSTFTQNIPAEWV